MKNHFDFIVLGAGLAGVSLSYELLQRNATVCLIDPREIGGGASGAPLGLVNPATGRYATKTHDAEICLNSVKENLERVQDYSPVQFYKQTGVLRPALNSKIAGRMKENVETSDWPEGWIKWLTESEVKGLHPGISCVDGGVWLPVGMTVDVGMYLKVFTDMMIESGLNSRVGQEYKIHSDPDRFTIILADGTQIQSDHLVFTTGVYSNEFDYWDQIKLHPVKGQLAVLKTEDEITFDHAVSALGYTSSLTPNRFLVGSTYEHTFESENTDQEGLDYLMGRFEKVLPKLKSKSRVIDQWAGIRASTPNRKPVIGSHPEIENLHIFAGLGSKGLLYSAYGSGLLCDYLFESKQIPDELSVNRFYK